MFFHANCSTKDTHANDGQEKKENFSVTDSLLSDSIKEEVTIPISPEEKLQEEVNAVLKDPEKEVNKETMLKAKGLVLKKDYDMPTLTDALNQLKPSLTRGAQRVVMNTIQMDFSDTEKNGVVKGIFIGEANEDYSIRGYMYRLTIVGPYKISVTNLIRDKSGKIISITLKEIEKLNS